MIEIPSYEDLTPGIPDVEHAATGLSSLLDEYGRNSGDEEHVRKDLPPVLLPSCSMLFACVRAPSCGPLLTIARDFSPRVMRVSDRELVFDVSGLGRLIGEPPAIVRELTRAMRGAGVDGAAAIAATCTAARLRAACGDPDAAIEALPVAALQPLEAAPTASVKANMNERERARPYQIFEKWGIVTLGDLAALPPDGLASRLGRRGTALQRLARGEDLAPFVPDADTPRYLERLELEWPIDALEPLSFVLPRLLDPLTAALERADRGAAAIRLELRLTDRTTHARVLQLPAAIREARVLRTLLLLDLEAVPPSPLRGFDERGPASAGIDVITIEIDPAPARITQFSLLARALPSPEMLTTLTARLSALVGESRVGSPALVDSYRPDAFVMERYAPDKGADGAKGANGAKGAGANGADGAVLRRRRPPIAIRVSVAQGRPVRIDLSRRGIPSGAIAQAAGPWRTSGDWWTQGTDACRAEGMGHRTRATGTYWNRDEWDVALQGGAVCRIYFDRTADCWFLEGTYD